MSASYCMILIWHVWWRIYWPPLPRWWRAFACQKVEGEHPLDHAVFVVHTPLGWLVWQKTGPRPPFDPSRLVMVPS